MSVNEQPVFEVRLRGRRVQRELDGLQEVDHERVVVKLRALANNPRPQGCEKLYDAIYRIRVGGFRIIYLLMRGTGVLKSEEFAGGAREPTGESRNYSVECPIARDYQRLIPLARRLCLEEVTL